MKQHRFLREGKDWYIDLPDFLLQGGRKADLQMVAGADKMLDLIAGTGNEVSLLLDVQPFPGADELLLTEICDPILGGGYYHLKTFEGGAVEQDMWLCEVTRFVFDDLPARIFIRRMQNDNG